MARDTTRTDFMERARLGIEGALSRFDDEAAERLRAALSTMRQLNAPSAGLDVLASPTGPKIPRGKGALN